MTAGATPDSVPPKGALRRVATLSGTAVSGLRRRAEGWQRSREPADQRAPGAELTTREAAGFPTAWARLRPVAAIRNAAQTGALVPLLQAELSIDAHGVEDLSGTSRPMLIVSNHASHLDAPVLLASLPSRLRRRVAVATPPRYFDVWWRAAASALAVNAFPLLASSPEQASTSAAALLADGWTVVVFPEGSRSADGILTDFHAGLGSLAQQAGVPVVPVGIRGTYRAMPRGRPWPVAGRPRAAVRFGPPLWPEAGESAAQFTARIERRVRLLVAEDVTSWWATERGIVADLSTPSATWRRIWQQTEEPIAGGRRPPGRIWRS